MWYTSFVDHEPTSISDTIRAAAASDRLLRAEDLDVPAWSMSRLADEGVVDRVVPGVYVGASCPKHGLIEAAGWTLRYPSAVACLLTAAVHHGLVDAFSRGTWLFVPKGTTVPRIRNLALNIVQITPRFIDPEQDGENGILSLEVHGVRLRLTNPDRTVIDLWKYPRRISSEHALTALRRRLDAPDFPLPAFARLGRRLGAWLRLERVVQGMIVR